MVSVCVRTSCWAKRKKLAKHYILGGLLAQAVAKKGTTALVSENGGSLDLSSISSVKLPPKEADEFDVETSDWKTNIL